MVIVYTDIIIMLLSFFNLWVSEYIVNFYIVNNKLNVANKHITDKNEELLQQKEEITAQRDEIEAQRNILQDQKDTIEEINMQINKSIDYAKRIQNAALPEISILKNYLTDYFILFKPRDIVSGDFYWFSHIDGVTVIVAADCTGHGVPGAFMSMLGISFLREIVIKEKILNPGLVLKELRKEIITSLHQTNNKIEQQGNTFETNVKDGMDIALLSINHKNKTLSYAGANNPLYFIKHNTAVIEEIKADKMLIAIHDKMGDYTTHNLDIENGDRFYIFSDGYADQFGGPKGKKFKYKPFKQLLLSNKEKSMEEQKQNLNDTFEAWRGNNEQVDDVLVIGLQI
ncbi:MAG: hypothetical protein Kow0068_05630 [Marinilabiliales bacterium]